jgi:hypothetical protein
MRGTIPHTLRICKRTIEEAEKKFRMQLLLEDVDQVVKRTARYVPMHLNPGRRQETHGYQCPNSQVWLI